MALDSIVDGIFTDFNVARCFPELRRDDGEYESVGAGGARV